MQQVFSDLIGGKLGLSQNIKTKQVFIVFDWKENTIIENEEGKVILDLLPVIYDFEEKKKAFLTLDYFLFILPQEAIIDKIPSHS